MRVLQNIRLLSIFNFLIGFSLFAPLAIIYFSQVSGSFTLGTSIFGLIMLSSAAFEVPTGVLSDKVGRKYTIVLGSVARVLAFIFYAIGFSYGWLVIGAVLEGVSRAFYSGNNDAFLYDTLVDAKKQAEFSDYQGKVNSSEQLSMAISAVLGSIIASASFPLVMWFSVLAQVAMLVVSLFFAEPKSRKKSTTNVSSHVSEAIILFIKNKKLRLLSMASIISFSISELKWQFSSAFIATVWPLWAIGLSKMLPSIGATLSFYFSGKLIKKFSAIKILIFDSIYGKSINLLALLFPTVFSPILMSTTSFLFGASTVAESTLMQHEFSDQKRATMSSLNSLAGSVGFFIMSLILGGLADALGPAQAMIIFTVISLPTICLYWSIFKTDRRQKVL